MKLEQTDLEVFKLMIKQTITDYFNKKENKEFEKKIFNITQTAEIIGKAYNFVSDRIKDETLKTTADNKHITGKEINRFLENC